MDKDPSLRISVPFELAEAHGLSGFEMIPGGHTGALLYRCRDQEERSRVVKLAVDESSEQEVRGNIYGYQAILDSGAEQLLPKGITSGISVQGSYLIMPDLGANVSEQARMGDFDHSSMLDHLERTIAATIKEAPGVQAYGLTEFCGHVGRVYTLLKETEQVSETAIGNLLETDISEYASDKASLMLLDFTPDNVFSDTEGVSFIDPWVQGVYLGSFIPSLAQFTTLTKDIYKLPGADDAADEFNRSLYSLGASLGLTEEQTRAQALLGEALQYGLSGYVRLQSDPELAQYYISRSERAVEELVQPFKERARHV